MSFTDDDLKRLKAEIPEEDYCHQICLHCGYDMKALLARLEASETVLKILENSSDLKNMDWFNPAWMAFQTWRKAAGK